MNRVGREVLARGGVARGIARPLAAALGAVLMACGCLAVQRDAPADRPAGLLEGVPADVDMVLTVRDLQRHRRTPAGRALHSMLRDFGFLDERTSDAWRALSTRLGWTPELAFDQLLGQRVTLLVGGPDAAGQRRWVLVGQVSAVAEELVWARLQPVPRSADHGLMVLAVEDGRYDMAICRAGVANPLGAIAGLDDGGRTATIVLAPRASAEMLKELLPIVAPCAAGARRAGAEFRGRFALASADVVVLARRSAAEQGAEWVTITANFTRDGLEARLAGTPTMLGVRGPTAGETWSTAALAGLSEGALVAAMGVPGALLPHLSSFVDLPSVGVEALGMERGVGRVVAIAVHPAPEKETGARLVAPPGVVAASEPAPTATAAERGPSPLLFTAAFDASDPRRLVEQADGRVVGLIPMIQEGDWGRESARIAVPANVLEDDAIRTVPLSGPFLERSSPYLGTSPLLRWGFAGVQGRGDRAWLVVSLGPASRQTERAVRSLSSAEGAAGAPGGARLSVGEVRPGAIVSWLSRADPGAAERLSPLRWIESIRWELRPVEGGTVEGFAELTLHGR